MMTSVCEVHRTGQGFGQRPEVRQQHLTHEAVDVKRAGMPLSPAPHSLRSSASFHLDRRAQLLSAQSPAEPKNPNSGALIIIRIGLAVTMFYYTMLLMAKRV